VEELNGQGQLATGKLANWLLARKIEEDEHSSCKRRRKSRVAFRNPIPDSGP
jgi:hypothetical protein